LKRSRSASIRQNAGRARLARWAKTASRLVPLHSRPTSRAWTEERHLGGRRLDAELGEEPRQLGIGRVVEDQETGVDAVADAVERDPDGVGVAAESGARPRTG
jgi:hypothetical protein